MSTPESSVRETWQLFSGETLLADLHVVSRDFPWLHARLRPTAAFDRVRALFHDELQLTNAADEADWSESAERAWMDAYNRIRTTCRLVQPNGEEAAEFMLHIDGEEAWWRWHNEPFDS